MEEVAHGRPPDRPAGRLQARPARREVEEAAEARRDAAQARRRRPRRQRLRRRPRGRADLRVPLRVGLRHAADERRRAEAGGTTLDQLDDETGDPRRLRAAAPRRAARAARVGRPRALRGRLARRHERDPRRDDPRPRLGRRRRLARPRPDADARDHRQPRARDPGLRPRAVLARPRELRPALRGPLVRPDQGRRQGHADRPGDLAEGGRARRGDRHEGLRQDRHRRVGRAQGAVRARAAPLRPHVAAARREPPLRLLGAPHAPGGPVALRGQEGDHVPAHELPLPLRRPRPAAEADRPDPRRRFPSTRRLRASCSSSSQLPLARVVNDAKVDDHHAIIPTDVEHDVSEFSPDERRIFDLVARRFLAVFHPPARYARTTVVTLVEDERFRTRGKVTLEAGWRGVYGVEADAPPSPARRTPRAPSSRRSRRASRSRSSPPRARRRRPGRRRATPRRRSSPRWRPRASSSTTRSCARR